MAGTVRAPKPPKSSCCSTTGRRKLYPAPLSGAARASSTRSRWTTPNIVIAVFDSRLGQATADAVSGTAEEIQRAVRSGKEHVHAWFSNEPVARDHNPEQLAALNRLRAEMQTQGLRGRYENPADGRISLSRNGSQSYSDQRRPSQAVPRPLPDFVSGCDNVCAVVRRLLDVAAV
jgi:hypothetical protein